MSLPGRPPFRADHVGSLLRPAALRQAFRRHAAGEVGDAEFERTLDQCIRDVVRMQEAIGLEVVTDGEFRRGSYWGRFVERTAGFKIRNAQFKFRNDRGDEVEFTAPYAEARLKRLQPLALDEFIFLRGVTSVAAKITLPAPSTMHFYRCTDFADRSVYPEAGYLFRRPCAVFEQEISGSRRGRMQVRAARRGRRGAVVRSGHPPPGRDRRRRARRTGRSLHRRHQPDRWRRVRRTWSSGCTCAAATSRGTISPRAATSSVAERFFSRANVNHFLLEYDTPRAGDFAPLRFVPKGKGVVLGLISSKTPVLEGMDMLKRRIDEATRYIDLDRLAVGPQCGFASTVAGNPLSEADQRAKLQLAVDAARAVWN